MQRPACLGGNPLFPFPYELAPPFLPELEACTPRLRDAFSRHWLSNFGPYVLEFEEKLAELFQVAAVATVCNATLGLIIALETIGAKGEVILPSYTFPATGQAVLWAGGKPVFADVDPDIPTLSVEGVSSMLSGDTRAILPMHCFGHAPDMENLLKVAGKAGVPLVCDAAQAVGTMYRKRPLPGLGDLDVVSFHATKILSIGEGGAILGNDKSLIEEARSRTNFGFTGKKKGMTEYMGLNAKLAELPAIIGLAQLERLDEMLARRKEWAETYQNALKQVPGIKTVSPRDGCQPNYQMFNIEVDPKEFKMKPRILSWALGLENVVTRFYFAPPCHLQASFQNNAFHLPPEGLPVTERKCATNFCLPMQPHRPAKQAESIAERIRCINENAAVVCDEFSRWEATHKND